MKRTQLLSIFTLVLLTSLSFSTKGNATDFAAPKSYQVGTSPSVIVVGDFNGDGKPDLAVGNAGSNDVSILLNNGDGTFKAAVNSPAGTSAQSMAAGDFNGDGKLDLVVINPGNAGKSVPGAVFLLLGNGDGTFQTPAAIASDKFPTSIAVADFNEDNKLDLLIGATLLLGKGDGTFQPGTALINNGDAVKAVMIGDFNGDKHVDVVVGVRSHEFNSKLTALALSLLAGKGDGTFQPAASIATVGSAPSWASSATVLAAHIVSWDFNGDGKLDVLLRYVMQVEPGSSCLGCDVTYMGNVAIFPGDGDGTFAGVVNEPEGDSGGGNICVADFNADGKQDFVFTNLGIGYLRLGHGDGSFITVPPLKGPPTGLGSFAAAATLNGDALSDVVITDQTNNAVVVFLNNSPTSGTDLDLRLSDTVSGNGVIQGEGTGSEIIWDVAAGGEIDYSVTVLNEGPQDATGVKVTESLPAGLKFISAQPSQGSCGGVTTITCDLGTMTDVSMATVSFAITATAAGTLTDALSVAATTSDLNSKNNSGSFTMNAKLPADLAVTQTASASSVMAGTQVTYTVTIKNNGPAQATKVMFNDTLPASASIASVQASLGSCVAPSNGVISCTLGTLAASANATISFGATLPAPGTMISAVAVSALEPDLDTSNNTGSLGVTVTTPPDFSIAPAANSLALKRGGTASDLLSFLAQGGFAGNISLTCAVTGPTPAPTCGISPASVTPGNTVTLTVSGPNLSAELAPVQTTGQFSAAVWPLWLLSALGLLASKKSAKEGRSLWLLFALIAAAAILPAACGGGSTQPAPQNFTVTVTATASPGAMQHTTQISVTVQ